MAWNVSTVFSCSVEFSETFLVNFWLDQGDVELLNWAIFCSCCLVTFEEVALSSWGGKNRNYA